MEYLIKNAIPLISAQNTVSGAAIRIAVLGGLGLTEEAKQHASGCTPWLWRQHKTEILALVDALEP